MSDSLTPIFSLTRFWISRRSFSAFLIANVYGPRPYVLRICTSASSSAWMGFSSCGGQIGCRAGRTRLALIDVAALVAVLLPVSAQCQLPADMAAVAADKPKRQTRKQLADGQRCSQLRIVSSPEPSRCREQGWQRHVSTSKHCERASDECARSTHAFGGMA